MENLREIVYPASIDDSMQPALYFRAPGAAPRPLVVGLHTWSFDHLNGVERYASICEGKGFDFIYPKFRGANRTPEACGSELVVSDIADAALWAKTQANIDPARVYLIGGSGGGHAALLLAGRRPELWTAVSAWCPISDLVRWHAESRARNNGYALHIEQACGGDPESDEAAAAEAKRRSPLTYLANASRTILDIATGIHDGHTGSVPVSQAIAAFNLLAAPADQVAPAEIEFMVQNEAVPEALAFSGADPSYGPYKVLFRRSSGRVRLTLFEGGHDLLGEAGIAFLENCRTGEAPDWSPRAPVSYGESNELSR